MKSIPLAVVLALLLVGVFSSEAQVTNFSIFKVTVYNQTNAAPPVTPNSPDAYYFGAQLNTLDSSNYVDVYFVDPNGDTTYLSQITPYYFNFGSPYFSNKTDFDMTYGSGEYDFYVDHTNMVDHTTYTDSGLVIVPDEDIYTTNIAAFTTNCWTAMQQVDPTRCFTLEWNPFTPSTNTTSYFTFVNVQDADGNTPFAANYLTPDTATTNIPACTLLYGETYTVNVFFSDRQDTQNAGFGDALGTVGFDHLTYTTLVTIPPWLHIFGANNSVTLTWPALATNFVLTSTVQLSPSQWSVVTNTPVTFGCTNSLVLPVVGSSQFFRLSEF